jgi:hypothetical protein
MREDMHKWAWLLQRSPLRPKSAKRPFGWIVGNGLMTGVATSPEYQWERWPIDGGFAPCNP